MKEAIYFNYNGINSKDVGVMHVHNSSGLYNEEFFSPFQLNTEAKQQNGRVVSSHYTKEPIEFSMTLYYNDQKSKGGMVNRIINWLKGEGQFAPMSFDTHPNFIVYARLKEIQEIQHNGIYEGTIRLTMITNSHYIYSVPYLTEIYEVENNKTIFLNYDGIDETEPKIWIEKIGKGELSINNRTSGKVFRIENLDDKEKLFVDNEKRIIYSDGELVGIHRGVQHNRTWLQLISNLFDGTNELEITGNCKIQFELQYKYFSVI